MDHRAVYPARAAVVGLVGFPSLEGRTEGQGTGTHPVPATYHIVHFHDFS